MLVRLSSWSWILLGISLDLLTASLIPGFDESGQGCQVLTGQGRDACVACTLHNQCTTLLEATLSIYGFEKQYDQFPKFVWFEHYERIAMFDAIAPFHPRMLGILTNIPKCPKNSQADDSMRKKSMLHAWYRFFATILPQNAEVFQTNMIMNLGLQVLDNLNSTDMATPEGIGNYVGNSVATYAIQDGMNCLGDMNGKKYNLDPFSDYTGYTPANSDNHISNHRLWQPDIGKCGTNGAKFSSQKFVTPQLALVKPFSVRSLDSLRVPPPGRMGSMEQYRRDTDEVIAYMAALNTRQKVMSEYFNNKITLLSSIIQHVTSRKSINDSFSFYLKLSTTITDALVAVWKEKTRYNMVRPFTAVRYLYGNQTIASYSKEVGKVVDDMPGCDWDSFLPTANHPEYPSATAAYCGSVAELMRLDTGSDVTDGFEWKISKYSSLLEAAQPPEDITLVFPTWTDWETQCAMSRVWAGTHFVDAVTEGMALGRKFSKPANDFVDFHVNGGLNA